MRCQQNTPGRTFRFFYNKTGYNFTIPPSWRVGEIIHIEINTRDNTINIRNYSMISNLQRHPHSVGVN